MKRTLLALLLLACLSLHAQNPTTAFSPATPADEAAIRAIIVDEEDSGANPHIAANLDWENAFGNRYTDLARRNAFYNSTVKPLQAQATSSILEVKIHLLKPDLAVADEYWHIAGQIDQATHKPGADRWGRTTFVFEKAPGPASAPNWIMVLSRVADLRAPYYKHYDALPAAVPVPAAALAACAGTWQGAPGRKVAEITVSGDHLVVLSRGRTYTGIPTSPTEFLVFDPNDLAGYFKLVVTSAATPPAGTTLTLLTSSGESIVSATRVP